MSVLLQTVLHGSQLVVNFHAGFFDLALLEDSQTSGSGSHAAGIVHPGQMWSWNWVFAVRCSSQSCSRSLMSSVSTADSSHADELLWPPFINQ